MKIKIPLFWKFTISIVLIVLFFGTINSLLIYKNVQTSLQEETEKRGLFISKSTSNQLTSYFLFEDLLSMQNLINGVKNIDPSIEYIFVVDKKGEVLVHTFDNKFPEQLLKINSLRDNDSSAIKYINYTENNNEYIILDIAESIISSKIGYLRIGLLESEIKKDVQKTVNTFWIMVCIFLFAGIIGALQFANFITKPIKSIQNALDTLELEKIESKKIVSLKIRTKFLYKFRILFRAEDEIDILADKFNEMLFRLQTAYLELQKTQNKLIQSEKLASIGTLTAGLAHEINNPVAGLKNCIRRISENPENISQNKKYIYMMDKASKKIEDVLSNLLDFSRMSSSDFESVSIINVIEKALLLVRHRLENNRVSVDKKLDKINFKVYGNNNRLEQVILNLLINSIDSFEEKKNELPDFIPKLIFKSYAVDNFLFIEVSDNGIGIPEDKLGRIFDPFYTSKVQGKGTGLGLSIVLNIVNSHNGSISVKNTNPDFITFTIKLPLYKN